MDKETLSNYGWIVICILVLSVMIALATPFGNYVSNAAKSTATGLFDVNKNAINSTGLINVEDQSFNDSKNTSDTITYEKREAGTLIPDGATYTKADGTTLEGNGTNKFPDAPETGDTYEEGDYHYHYKMSMSRRDYSTGWNIQVTKDRTKTTYEPITIIEIAGEPVTGMGYCFAWCRNLKTAPTIPYFINDIRNIFEDCPSLTGIVTIDADLSNDDKHFGDSPYDAWMIYSADPSTLTITGTSPQLNELITLAKNIYSTVNATY